MLRINRLTDYGTLALTYLATHPGRMHSAADVASALGLGVPTVSKVLKTLGRHDLVRSNRGLRGGYSLSREPETISVAQIVDALEEQPFGLTECSASEGVCGFERSCRIRTNWQRINRMVRHTLESVSLADMMHVVPVDDRPARTAQRATRGRSAATAAEGAAAAASAAPASGPLASEPLASGPLASGPLALEPLALEHAARPIVAKATLPVVRTSRPRRARDPQSREESFE